MKPATIILDFDSTIVAYESLEWLIAKSVSDPEKLKQIEDITCRGMNGEIDFPTSLRHRLEIASPQKSDIRLFVTQSPKWFASGLQKFLKSCEQFKTDVWVISGGLQDLIIPVVAQLGIPAERVRAIEVDWHNDQLGTLVETPALLSKCEAFQKIERKAPVWAIGDGFSDFQLFKTGLVDRFFAYCEFIERPFVQSHNLDVVRSFDEITSLLEKT